MTEKPLPDEQLWGVPSADSADYAQSLQYQGNISDAKTIAYLKHRVQVAGIVIKLLTQTVESHITEEQLRDIAEGQVRDDKVDQENADDSGH
jgi:hypothetical protein